MRVLFFAFTTGVLHKAIYNKLLKVVENDGLYWSLKSIMAAVKIRKDNK